MHVKFTAKLRLRLFSGCKSQKWLLKKNYLLENKKKYKYKLLSEAIQRRNPIEALTSRSLPKPAALGAIIRAPLKHTRGTLVHN